MDDFPIYATENTITAMMIAFLNASVSNIYININISTVWVEQHLIVTARRYASAVYAVIVCRPCPSVWLSVCLSVRLSVTSWSSTKMAKPETTPYDSPGTLVCRCQKCRRNFNGVTPTGAPNRGGVGSDRRFSTIISLCLRNGVR